MGGMGGGDFFSGMLGDVLKLLGQGGATIQWELAFHLAQSVATDGQPEANVDPVERIRLEEIYRIAEMHVADITGAGSTASLPKIEAVSRAEWARRSLTAWKPFLERLAEAVKARAAESPAGPAPGVGRGGLEGLKGLEGFEGLEGLEGLDDLSGLGSSLDPLDPLEADGEAGDAESAAAERFAKMFEQLASAMTPSMLAMQVGGMAGHLSRTALGQYEVPLPRSNEDGQLAILAIPENIAAFASDWSLPPDDVRMWICVTEATYQTVLARPHVRERLADLLVANVGSFRVDPDVLTSQMEGLDPSDMGALSRLFGNPSSLSMAASSPEAERVRGELAALTAVIVGYVDHVANEAASRVIGSKGALAEAFRRRRADPGEGEKAAEMLFGWQVDQEQIDRGRAFVRGVLERGGETDLARIFLVEGNLPTPAEVDAPGLWLERINLPGAEPGEAGAGGAQPGEEA